ncbi:hypothetical protein KDL29_01665 [bacterium]|nr:hypothetical protein [bacterium]
MKKTIFLAMAMLLAMAGMAQAKEGCRCGRMIGYLEVSSPEVISYMLSNGKSVTYIYQGSPQETWRVCYCHDPVPVCKTQTYTWHPSGSWDVREEIYGDDDYYLEATEQKCKWWNGSSGPECKTNGSGCI